MFERQSQQMRRQAILADIALTVWLLFGAYLFRELMLGATSPLLPYVALVPVIAPLWVFLLTFFGAYTDQHGKARGRGRCAAGADVASCAEAATLLAVRSAFNDRAGD